MSSNNVLITGVTGFVGSHLAKKLTETGSGENVVGLVRDSIPSMWLDEVLEDVTLVQGDIRNFELLERLISHYEINQVYHLGAAAQVKSAFRDPINVYESNIMGTVNVLEACRLVNRNGLINGNDEIDKKNRIKILIMQTDKIYGEKLNATEDDCYRSSEPYATSKVCQAMVAKSYNYTYGLNIIMPSFCNIFGLDLYNSRLIPNVIKQCIRGLQPVVWSNDKSIREYIYISDVVDSLISLMDFHFDNKHLTYNVSTGWVYNQKNIIEKIANKFNIECLYDEVSIVKQIQDETMVSIRDDWKFEPSITFDDAIQETIELFKEYEDDWNK